ncbi:MAG: hypothetical protein JNK65_09035, partial [Deltaproteobacteria bacterium]|nr:hypothetical protein [Deltaproteobacteria bacterium]
MKCPPSEKVEARCSYFKNCGGCVFQDISYSQELFHKRERMRLLLQEAFPDIQIALSEVVPSPQEYHYRHRLDIGMRRTKEREMVFGFVNQEGRRLVEIDSCAIARKEISDFLPQLKQEAIQKWPEDYRVASLCVRVGDDRKVRWG